MTKRIDFWFDWEGKLKYHCDEKEFAIDTSEKEIAFHSKNWTIKVDLKVRRIYIHSFSNAKKKRRDFSIYVRSGSLFLYNSTTDWYWYWRNKSLQDELDAYRIDKICTLNNDTIEMDIILKDNNGIPEPISEGEQTTLKLFPNDVEMEFNPKYYAHTWEDTNFIISSCKIKPDKFVIIESDDHKILYVRPKLKIDDLVDEHLLDDFNLNYPDFQRSEILNEFIKRNRERIYTTGD